MKKLVILDYLGTVFILYSDNLELCVDHILNKTETFRDVCSYCSKHNIKMWIPDGNKNTEKFIIKKLKKIILQYENLFATDEEIDIIVEKIRNGEYYTLADLSS